jgi:hypothetical protein
LIQTNDTLESATIEVSKTDESLFETEDPSTPKSIEDYAENDATVELKSEEISTPEVVQVSKLDNPINIPKHSISMDSKIFLEKQDY